MSTPGATGRAAAAREAPPGGILLPIAWGTVKAQTCTEAILVNFSAPFEKPAFHPGRPHLPGLQEEAWERFSRDTRIAVAGMWRSGWEILGLVIVLPVLLLIRLLGVMPEGAERILLARCVATCVGIVLVLRFAACRRNESCDAQVRAACTELAGACHGRVSVEYRTLYTGFCKPRLTQPFRAIALGPVAVGPVAVGTWLVDTVP